MKTYGDYLNKIFPGIKVQKLSVDAGFSCPNRDGSIATGGCIYCRNDSFSPSYCSASDSVADQIQKGKLFFSRKYPDMKYLAYFQSYTGTYNKPIDELKSLYYEALSQKDVLGLVIATRPDCINDGIASLLADINKSFPVFVEFGAETSHDHTLRLINRNHTWRDVELSVTKIANEGIHCGIHLIAGLPGEDREMILETVRKTVALPVETIKLHQLQVLKGTPLLDMVENNIITIPEFSLEEYLQLCAEIVKMAPPEIIIERFLAQAPSHLVVYPSWGLKNYQFMYKLAETIEKNNR